MKNWRQLAKKYIGPILPRNYAEAARWLGGDKRIKVGFVHFLVRSSPNAIHVHKTGEGAVREWYFNPTRVGGANGSPA